MLQRYCKRIFNSSCISQNQVRKNVFIDNRITFTLRYSISTLYHVKKPRNRVFALETDISFTRAKSLKLNMFVRKRLWCPKVEIQNLTCMFET